MICIHEIERSSYLAGDDKKAKIAAAYADLANEASELVSHIEEDLEPDAPYKLLKNSAERVRDLLEKVYL